MDPWGWLRGFDILVLPEFEIPDPVGPISVVDRISLITKFDSDTDVVMGDQLQPGSVFRTDFDFNIGSFADDSLMNSIQLYSFQAGRGSFIGGGMRITATTGQVLMTGRISALKTTEKNPPPRPEFVDRVLATFAI